MSWERMVTGRNERMNGGMRLRTHLTPAPSHSLYCSLMGRYFSVIFPVGAPEPPKNTLINADTDAKPVKSKPGIMDRFAMGITYSTASGLVDVVIVRAGYKWDEERKEYVSADSEKCARYPNIRLLAKFYTQSEMTWTKEECVQIATDMERFFDDMLALYSDSEEEEEKEKEEEDPEPDTRRRYAPLYEDFPYGPQILAIFKEAVFRGGEVETN